MSGNSYQYPQCGPWNQTVDGQLDRNAQLNTSFSQRGWTDAKQDGCLPAPCGPYPSWPPPQRSGYIYPTDDSEPQVVQGSAYVQDSPFIDNPKPRTKPAPMFCPSPKQYAQATTGMSYEQAQQAASHLLNNPPNAPLGLPFVPSESIVHSTDIKRSTTVPSTLKYSQLSHATKPSKPEKPVHPKTIPSVTCTHFKLDTVFACTWNSFLGFIYDLRHYSQLPKKGVLSKLKFAITRDHRGYYLLFFIFCVILLVVILKAIF